MLYRTLINEKRITWETFLVKGLGMTSDEAKEEIINTIADEITKTNPVLADALAEDVLTAAGAGRQVQELRKQGLPLIPGGLMEDRQGQPRSFTGNPESQSSVRQMFEAGQDRTPPLSTGGG